MKALVHDNFKIQYRYSLNGEDYISLTRMYLPIMGIDSYSLYSLLFTLNPNEKYSFKFLVDTLSLNTLNLLSKAFSKLEALSLVRSFFNETKGYVFQLFPPLSRTAFLEDSILSSFLSRQIGEVEYRKIISEVGQFTVRGYQNITQSFDQVFKVKTDSLENIFSRIYKQKNLNQIKIENPDFDYIFFKMNFDSNFIDPKVFDDEELKQQILNISYNYQLNEEEMKEVIIQSMSVEKDLKPADISKHARRFFQKKNKNTEPRFVTAEPDVFLDSETDDDTYSLLKRIENISSSELLKELNDGINPSVSELKMIEDLINNTKFSRGVINLMILLVNNEKEGVLPGYNYFEKIANTWARAGIKNAQDAIKFINKKKDDTKSSKIFTRGKKETELPDWYQDYEKQLDNLPSEEELSEDEINKILESAKKRYG